MSRVAADPVEHRGDAQPGGWRRAQIRVIGTVQGVGFRPYVHRLAGELALGGWVLNDAQGVLLEIEGSERAVAEFRSRLTAQPPPLALIERVLVSHVEPRGEHEFEIRASVTPPPNAAGIHRERVDAPVSVDTATCDDCLHELLDPGNRRFRYAFTNCTNCGPRFTIVHGVPYDRPLTTMASFTMCPECQAEYDDPGDRRFHAQPNACPVCGPRLSLFRDGREVAGDPLAAAALALRDGAIVAVKGIGGFHLACRADDERAVARLRARKHREDKPFALMVASVGDAELLMRLRDPERQLLSSPQRPIVLAPARAGAAVAESVAPRARELGVMLPYSPLHHLLLSDFAALLAERPAALVMTSGNVSDEPIAYTDDDALERLPGIAELFLLNDREIETRTDDSVLRAVTVAGDRHQQFLRRSRGYVPASTRLAGGTPVHLLACGAEQKSTFCLAKGERAWVSHHIGDLENYETLRSFRDGVAHFERLFDVRPQVVAHDLHPEYLSTKHAIELAQERDGVTLVAVQHHHAHLAACLAEHRLQGPAVGAIFDGTGYGTDGTIWGGEILLGDLTSFSRAGSLMPVRLPGGSQAVREPWRMACAWLLAAGDGTRTPEIPARLRSSVDPGAWERVAELAKSGLASPVTTSIGRLLDAIAALCGLRSRVSYEGQAAIELEWSCIEDGGRYEVEVREDPGGALVIDPREAVLGVVADLGAGVPAGVVATRFHAGIADATVRALCRRAHGAGVEVAVLSGGVFQNRRLLEAAGAAAAAAGLRVLTPRLLPANDGGISFGQAAVAAARIRGGLEPVADRELRP